MRSMRETRKRYAILCGTIVCLFIAVALRLAWLQLWDSERLTKLSEQQLTADITRSNPRGKILDRDGEELAVSIMTSSLYVDPMEMVDTLKGKRQQEPIRDVKRLGAELLGPVLQMDVEELYEIFNSEGRFLWVKRTLEPKEAEAVKKIIEENKLPGLHFLEESKRYYTKKGAAAQVLGFVGTDDIGWSGIEYTLNDILSGVESRHEGVFNALGGQMLGKDAKSEKQENLFSVYLTLDSKMQYVLEDAMDDAIKRTKAKGATAIIMDPYTGEILGMSSRPNFDPNKYHEYSPEAWSNKAVSMIYEPGSVFKPIVACMGMAEQLITPNTIFKDDGRIQVADRVIHNWDYKWELKGKGEVPFSDIIKYSINTGMVQLGMELGAHKLTNYSKLFGFGAPTGIELPGEESGILYKAEEMYKPDVATMAIGQGIAVTPIQMLRAICAIANGGELLQPYIVKKIVAPNGDIVREGEKKVIRQVISKDTAAKMRTMMEQVVEEGGGKSAAIKGYRIAGKTGTAEKLAEKGGYEKDKYIASFVGFVPADKPLYAMLVMIDDPQGAFYGSQVSAPIFRDTLQQILVAKGIQPISGEGLPSFEQLEQVEEQAKKKEASVPQLTLLENGKIKLPDFKGVDMRRAAGIIRQGRLRLKPYGSGFAYEQKPAPGSVVAEGETIEIWFK
ncbi:MAG: peptidoglycan glycosyltransferase [Phascolarctobacterium sp.]|nr:peptidoglycan glycosyltransferase [Phascolarctobacterium sp.]